MTDFFLPRDIQAGLEEARKRDQLRRARLRVRVGDETYPILRFSESVFRLDAGQVAHLRGLVDIYDGARHLYQSLIVASEIDNGELVCTSKRMTAARETAPLDYARDEDAPVAALPPI